MSALFRHLRIHQIWGANTDVGKTILTTALVRASALRKQNVFYLKPVSTGPHDEADDGHVAQFTASFKERVQTECLYRFGVPVSPHLAAQMALETDVDVSEKSRIPDDQTFVDAVSNYITRSASQSRKPGQVMYVEGAGGVHSPTLSGTTQIDSYRPLFLPAVLVGDSRLGGISATISSYESLLLRGYIVDAIVMFRDEYFGNFAYLRKYFQERGVLVAAVEPPPPRLSDPGANFAVTDDYYRTLTACTEEDSINIVVDHLEEQHLSRIQELNSMPERTLNTIWWPFVQHGLATKPKDVTVIDSASTDFFSVYHSSQEVAAPKSLLESVFDGSASWWTQALGHAHPALALAAANAAGRYGHIMFPQATHAPALRLAERLVQDGPGKGWAARAFFSDDGSTGMEIALKMALRNFCRNNPGKVNDTDQKELGILGLKGSYHGDTIGAMDACEEGVYTCEWHHAKGYWFEPPTVGIHNGKTVISIPSTMDVSSDASKDLQHKSLDSVYDVPGRLNTSLAGIYREYIKSSLQRLSKNGSRQLGALVIEPLLMGAGGMVFVDPLFQRILVDIVRGIDSPSPDWVPLPVIFDEVFVGLYRIGMQSTTAILGVNPDISVLAKILTGGTVPMSVTLATDAIFKSFLSNKKTDALLHGHSYTAHPIGCAVANKTLDIIETVTQSHSWQIAKFNWRQGSTEPGLVWSLWDSNFVSQISKAQVVQSAMALGTVLAIKFRDNEPGYASTSAQTLLEAIRGHGTRDPFATHGGQFGIHFRTLGNVAYFMTSLNTPLSTIKSVEDRIWAAVEQKANST